MSINSKMSEYIEFDYYYTPKSGLIYNHVNQTYIYNCGYNHKWECIGGCSNYQQNDYTTNTLVIRKNNKTIEFPFTCNSGLLLYKLDEIMNNFNNIEDIDLNEIKTYLIN